MNEKKRDYGKHPLHLRLLALALSMLLTSSGFQTLAEEPESQISAEEQARAQSEAEAEAARLAKESEEAARLQSESESEAARLAKESEEAARLQSESESEAARLAKESEEQAKRQSEAEAEAARAAQESGAQETDRSEAQTAAEANQSEPAGDTQPSAEGTEAIPETTAQTEPATAAESQEAEAEEAELKSQVKQEVFTEADGTLAVRYTIEVTNKSRDTEAGNVSVKAVLGKELTAYGREGETKDISRIEDIRQIPSGLSLEELKEYSAEQLDGYGCAVLWKDQNISGGEKKEYIFFARVDEGAHSKEELPALFFVEGKGIRQDKQQWLNTELLDRMAETEGTEPAEETELPQETESAEETELPQETESAEETELPQETESAEETELLQETASAPAVTLTASAGTVTVTAEAAEGVLPQGATMTAEEVDNAAVDEALTAEAEANGLEVVAICVFDITFYNAEGEEIQPEGKVEITYTGLEIPGEAEEALVYHVEEEANVTELLSDSDLKQEGAGEIHFGADHFSYKPVVFARQRNANGLLIKSEIAYDGTEPFDQEEGPGHDTGAQNKIIRPYDTLQYITAADLSGQEGPSVDVHFELSLPVGKEKAEFFMTYANGFKDLLYKEEDGIQVISGIYEGQPSECKIPVTINIKAMNQGEQIAPTGSFWLDGAEKTEEVYPVVTVSNHDTYITKIDPQIASSGTSGSAGIAGTFDSSDAPGYDSSADNTIVRAFDTLTYRAVVDMASYTGNEYGTDTLNFSVTLPISRDKAEIDLEGMQGSCTGYAALNLEESADGSAQTLTGTYTLNEEAAASHQAELPLVIKVYGMNQNEVIQPEGMIWQSDSCQRNAAAGTVDETDPDAARMFTYCCAAHNWTQEKYDISYPSVTVSNHDTYVKDVEVSIGSDGTADFDKDNDPGNDDGPNNGIVRSFDSMYYDLNVIMESYSKATYESGFIHFEVTLPVDKTKAIFDESAMEFLDTMEVITNPDGTQTLRGSYRAVKSKDANEAIPGTQTLQIAVKVRAMKNGETFQPTGKIWMEDNYTGERTEGDATVTTCPSHQADEVKELSFPPVTVSAKMQLNVQLTQTTLGESSIEGTFDFGQGNQINSEYGKVYGRLFGYGITLQLYQPVKGKGMKGQELPDPNAEIQLTLDLTSSYKTEVVKDADGNVIKGSVNYASDSEVMSHYQPILYSAEGNKTGNSQSDGRPLVNSQGYGLISRNARYGAPVNKGTSKYNSCENGGTWTMNSQEGNTVSITVKGYEITKYQFPNTNYGNASTTSTYHSPDAAVEDINIACFSAGEIWFVQPYKYTDDDGEEHGLVSEQGAGSFTITAKDTLVKATSVTGVECTTQEKTDDDSRSFTQNITPPGTYDNRIWYTTTNGGWHNVMGEYITGQGNGYAVLGSNIGIFCGYDYSPNGVMENRQAASNTMLKFDGSVLEIDTAKSISGALAGSTRKIFYGYRSDGMNWASESEMLNAAESDLVWKNAYDSSSVCVAVLIEQRGIVSSLSRILPGYIVRVKVKTDPALIDTEDINKNVHIICQRTRLWTTGKLGIDDSSTAEEIAERIAAIPSAGSAGADLSSYPEASHHKAYEDYHREVYDENGVTGKHTYGNRGGDSLLLLQYKTSIEKAVAQQVTEIEKSPDGTETTKLVSKINFNLDRDERTADFVLTPKMNFSYDLSVGEGNTYTTLTVTDTLPAGMAYEIGSARWNAEYIQSETEGRAGTIQGGTVMTETATLPDAKANTEPWDSSNTDDTVVLVEKQEDGTTKLTFQIRGVPLESANYIGKIYYRTTLGDPSDADRDLKNGNQLSGDATVKTTEDCSRPFSKVNGNLASATVTITKLGATAFSKSVKKILNEVNEDLTWKLSWNNNGNSTSIQDVQLLDTMPKAGDSAGSSFDGSYQINDWRITSSIDYSRFTLYYTTEEKYADCVLAEEAGENQITWDTILRSGDWQTLTIDGDGKAAFPERTADDNGKYSGNDFVTAWALGGKLYGGETLQIEITVHQDTPVGGDALVNTASTGLFERSAAAYRVQRGLSGYVWLDEDLDGRKESNEKPFEGVTATLQIQSQDGTWKDAENLLGEAQTTLTDANGYYQFDVLPSGNCRVVFTDRRLTGYTLTEARASSVPNSQSSKAAMEGKEIAITDITMPAIENMAMTTYNLLYQNAGFGRTVDFEVTKEWSDDNDASIYNQMRPQSVTVSLYKDADEELGTPKTLIRRLVLTPDAEGSWQGSFSNLPAYENGQEIDYTKGYTIEESVVSNYTSEIGAITKKDSHFEVTLKNSADVKEIHTPTGFDIQKYRTGTTIPAAGAKFVLSEDGNADNKVEVTTDEDGKASFTFDPAATGAFTFDPAHWGEGVTSKQYTLRESEAPSGYTKDSTEWAVTATRAETPVIAPNDTGNGFTKTWSYSVSVKPKDGQDDGAQGDGTQGSGTQGDGTQNAGAQGTAAGWNEATDTALGCLTVYNDYDASGSAVLSGTKSVTGGPMRNDFQFAIYTDAQCTQLLKDGWSDGTDDSEENKEPDVKANPVTAEAEEDTLNDVDCSGAFAFELHYNLNDLKDTDQETGLPFGTRTYYIKELEPAAGSMASYVTDPSVYTITVTMKDNGDGTLDVKPSVISKKTKDEIENNPESGLSFVNTFAAVGNASFAGTKQVIGGQMKSFQFNLYDTEPGDAEQDENVLATVSSNALDGSISMQIPQKKDASGADIGYAFDMSDMITDGKYQSSKDFSWFVKEVPVSYNAEGVGYQSSGELYKVTVTMKLQEVTPDGGTDREMQLVQTAAKVEKKSDGSWEDVTESGGMVFTNNYQAKGKTTVSVRKILTGTALTDSNKFTFLLTPLDAPAGHTEQTATNNPGTAVAGVTNTYQAEASFADLTYTMDDLIEKDENGENKTDSNGNLIYVSGRSFTYMLSEQNDGKPQYTYDSNKYVVEVTVSDADKDGTLDVTAKTYHYDEAAEDKMGTEVSANTLSGVNAVFNNSYVIEGNLQLQAEKILTGQSLMEGQFTFELKSEADAENGAAADTENLPEPEAKTIGKTGDIVSSLVTFDQLSYDQDDVGKTYCYIITEQDGKDGKYIYDATEYKFLVTISDKGGEMGIAVKDVTAYPADTPEDAKANVSGGSVTAKFTNHYTAKGGFTLSAAKKLLHRDTAIEEGEFTFEAYELLNGVLPSEPVATAATAAGEAAGQSAAVKFTDFEEDFFEITADTTDYSSILGIHTYIILEKDESGVKGKGGIAYSNKIYKVVVTVDDNSRNGTLNVSAPEIFDITPEAGQQVDYTAEGSQVTSMEFTNDWLAEGKAELTIDKALTGNRKTGIAEGEFGFTAEKLDTSDLTEEISLPDDLQKLNGTGVTYTGAVEKSKAESSGDTENGTYHTTAGIIIPYTQADLSDDGAAVFWYKLTENDINDSSVEKEPAVFYVKIEVENAETDELTENGVHALQTSVTYYGVDDQGNVAALGDNSEGTQETPSFTNHYRAKGNIALQGTKKLIGNRKDAMEDKEFTFQIVKKIDEAGELTDDNLVVVSTGTNSADEDGDGSAVITFDEIDAVPDDETNPETLGIQPFTQDDIGKTFIYYIREVDKPDDAVAVETEPMQIQVKVEDGDQPGNLFLTLTGDTEEKDIVFTNHYHADGSVVLTGTKRLLGDRKLPMMDGEFTFQVKEDGVKVADGSVKADGTIAFDQINYTEENLGVHTYEISEITGTDKNMEYSSAVFQVQVTVSDNGDGTLKADTSYPQGGVIFENRYTEKVESSITVTKHLSHNGAAINTKDHTFYVALFADEELQQRVSDVKALTFRNNSASTVTFEEVATDRTYYVGETDAAGNSFTSGVLPSGELFAAEFPQGNRVYVGANGGALELSFENTFPTVPEGFYREGELTLTKRLLGADGKEMTSDETFYAGIFADKDHTALSDMVSANIVALNLNGGSTASETIKVSYDDNGSRTLYVTEVDENGTPVAEAEDFVYEVSVDQASVTISDKNLTDSVTITNQEKSEDESEEESESNESGKSDAKAGKSVKTGDDTPVGLYVLLLAAAAAVMAVLGFRRRRRNVEEK